MTHDFRPGDVVQWQAGLKPLTGHVVSVSPCATVIGVKVGTAHYLIGHTALTFVSHGPRDVLPEAAPTEHPSRARAASSLRAADPVDHPAHYTDHPSGVECITVTEHMNFNVGNAVKYLWRAGRKGDVLEDLRKAAWYVNREIERLTREAGS